MQSVEESLRQANTSLQANNYELEQELKQVETVLLLADEMFRAGQVSLAAWQRGEERGNHDEDLERGLASAHNVATDEFYAALQARLKIIRARPPADDEFERATSREDA